MEIPVCSFKGDCPCKIPVYKIGDEDGAIEMDICDGSPRKDVDVVHCPARDDYTIYSDMDIQGLIEERIKELKAADR